MALHYLASPELVYWGFSKGFKSPGNSPQAPVLAMRQGSWTIGYAVWGGTAIVELGLEGFCIVLLSLACHLLTVLGILVLMELA